MPLITERVQVLDIYREAAARRWIIPTFCSENLTTTEAILAAVKQYGEDKNLPRLPVTVAITNLYDHRAQTLNYTRSGSWQVGLKLFMADLRALCEPPSPFAELRVMAHLDHIQPHADAELLNSDLSGFSSIMFDASARPFEENMRLTADFMQKRGGEIVVEGACDEIVDAAGDTTPQMTTPERASQYLARTGVDFMVANLGTEHRAGTANLLYHGELARAISAATAPRLVLHGCSSVAPSQMRHLFDDGIRKVNIWTALERDSVRALLEDMTANAAKIIGPRQAARLRDAGLLGPRADTASPVALDYFPTVYRQDLMFQGMRKIVRNFLALWYQT